MKTAIYISEMCAAPIHGGGITLGRVLRDDVCRFDKYIKVISYSTEPKTEWPSSDKYLSYSFWPDSKSIKKIIGCSLAYKLFQNSTTRRQHANSVADDLIRRSVISPRTRLLVCPQGEFSLYIVNRLRRHLGVRYVTWFMDDHLVKWNGQGWYYPHNLGELMKDHLSFAEHVYTISPELRSFYKSTFGADSTVLFSPCEKILEPIWQTTNIGQPCNLAYFGSIGRWQQDALELILPLVKRRLVQLDIFPNDESTVPDIFRQDGVTIRSKIAPANVAYAMRNYDSVVLPISFNSHLKNMSSFNIATKMAESLSCGVPVFVIGPKDSAMIKFLEPHKAAITAYDPAGRDIEAAIQQLNNSTQRGQVIANAQKLVRTELSKQVMWDRWKRSSEWLSLSA